MELSRDAFSKLEELNVRIELLKMTVILRTGSPEVEVRCILGQQQIATLLKQETLRKRHTSKLLFRTRIDNAIQSALDDIESGGKLEGDAVFEVNRPWLSERIEALQVNFQLILRNCAI